MAEEFCGSSEPHFSCLQVNRMSLRFTKLMSLSSGWQILTGYLIFDTTCKALPEGDDQGLIIPDFRAQGSELDVILTTEWP